MRLIDFWFNHRNNKRQGDVKLTYRSQNSTDEIVCRNTLNNLIIHNTPLDCALLEATSRSEFGHWLHAIPSIIMNCRSLVSIVARHHDPFSNRSLPWYPILHPCTSGNNVHAELPRSSLPAS